MHVKRLSHGLKVDLAEPGLNLWPPYPSRFAQLDLTVFQLYTEAMMCFTRKFSVPLCFH